MTPERRLSNASNASSSRQTDISTPHDVNLDHNELGLGAAGEEHGRVSLSSSTSKPPLEQTSVSTSSSSRSFSYSRNGHLSPNPPLQQLHIGDDEDEEGDGDIGYSVPAPRLAFSPVEVSRTQVSNKEDSTTPVRDLTRARTRSRSPSPSPRPHHDATKEVSPSNGINETFELGQPGPSRRVSTSGSFRSITPMKSPVHQYTSYPLSRTNSNSHSGSGGSSSPPIPQPRFVPFKSPLPTATPLQHDSVFSVSHVNSEDHGMGSEVDDSAPFESIPLQSTPPLPASTSGNMPLSPGLRPGSSGGGRKEKRRSWNGFGGIVKAGRRGSVPNAGEAEVGNGNGVNGHGNGYVATYGTQSAHASSTSVNNVAGSHSSHVSIDQVESRAREVSAPTSGSGSASGSRSSSSAPPRRHAPPAHPHPFPIPSVTSPPLGSTKRLSTTVSTQSSSTHLPSVTGSNSGQAKNGAAAPAAAHAHAHGPALGTKGISTFEKVISQTRPSWLPPKDKTEDEIHYHQWEEMMAKARETEKERRKAEEIRRIEKDRKLAIATPIWEEMLSDKDFSVEKVRANPRLRQVWFEGAPTYLRGKAWSLAIGNPLAMSKDAYRAYLVRAKKALDSGRFPQAILDQMEKDLDETLVNLHLFQRGSPLRSDLKELICAWVVYRSDDGLGYSPHINLLAALFLLTSPPSTAFLSLVNLLSRPLLRAFYSETQDEISAFYRVFENLQADNFPMIFANCKNLGLKVPESWFRSVLVEQVPFEAVCRLWDQIVLDGDGYIFRAALAIFGFLEPRLYYPDHDEILSVLEGRNRATLAITERERERAKLRGETYNNGLDGKMSVFGLNEAALFDWLEKDGWREARFERLVVREMPD